MNIENPGLILPTIVLYLVISIIFISNSFYFTKLLQNKLKNPADAPRIASEFLNDSFFVGVIITGLINNFYIMTLFQDLWLFYVTTLILFWTCITSSLAYQFDRKQAMKKFSWKWLSLAPFHGIFASSILIGQIGYFLNENIIFFINYAIIAFSFGILFYFVGKKLYSKKMKEVIS